MQEKITHKKYLQEKYRKRVNMADKASKTKKASKFKGFNNILAVRLRQLMYGSGTTQQELAEKTGCSRQAIAQYMDGSNAPNIDKLILIAEFFNVSIDYLVGKDKEQTEEELVQSIVNYTGLDENSIEALQTIKNSKKSINSITLNPPRIQSTMQILNKLISDGTLLSIVDLSMAFNNAFNLQEDYLVAAITALKEYKKEHIEKYVNDTDILEYQQYEKSKDNSELCLFKLQELVKDELKENISEQRERISKLNKEYKLLLKTHKLSDIFPDELNKDGESNVNNT